MGALSVLVEVIMNINDFKSAEFKTRSDINFIRIPVNILGFDEIGVTSFNEIIEYWENQYDEWNTIVRTPSGGICKVKGVLRLPAMDIIVEKAFVELTILTCSVCARYQVSINSNAVHEVGKKIGGSQAYRTFVSVCNRHNVDLREFAIENGLDVKKEIASPMIKCMNPRYLMETWKNVHHIDLNSSYMSGIAQACPALEPAIREIYNKRKDPAFNKPYKAVLNCSYGFFQSKYCRIGGHGYALAHLSKAAREYNDKYILDLIERLESTGRLVLMINTDGIWYAGDVYHDENEGTDLGQWKNDHTHCMFRMKSNGAYEFIENGEYTPVVRGSTRLDQILDRAEWKWGDILRYDAAMVNMYHFDKKSRRIIKTEVRQ